jgi:hypothetical protein
MEHEDFRAQVSSIGALAEPTRLALYRYVVGAAAAVSREQAADDMGIALHSVKFHQDRLVEEGLLEVEYRRLTGRTGRVPEPHVPRSSTGGRLVSSPSRCRSGDTTSRAKCSQQPSTSRRAMEPPSPRRYGTWRTPPAHGSRATGLARVGQAGQPRPRA